MELIELAKKIEFPHCSGKKEHEIKNALRSISKQLRDAYYKEAPTRPNVYLTPFGGPIGDSIGPWPEFILRGLPCQKSKQGCCTPCFYSRMPQVECSEKEIYESLVNQVEHVISNFDSLVVHNQWGPVAWKNQINDNKDSPLALVVTPTGSFFDEYEFPFDVRKRILLLFIEHSKKIKRPIALHIESHAEHFLKAAEDRDNFNEIISLLNNLNSRIIFGFESDNEYVRNVLYNKFLPKKSFEDAVKLAKQNNLPVGAFVFVGANPLNDIETISDSISTLDYLRTINVSPVIMFHNVQQYTIQELLYIYKSHKLPDPRTVLEVVKYLASSFHDKPLSAIDSWLLSDPIGGPPPPQYSIFSARERSTCRDCATKIYDSIVALRRSRDSQAFLKSTEELSTCECSRKYLSLVKDQLKNSKSLIERTDEMLSVIGDKYMDYISTVRPILNEIDGYDLFKDSAPRSDQVFENATGGPSLKAELLCYGLRVSNDIKEDLAEYNSYVHEAGFVHAAHFLVGDHLINTCISEKFCEHSPYYLQKKGGRYEISKGGNLVAPCDVLRAPDWCSEEYKGYKLGDVLRPHSHNVLSGMPNSKCMFFRGSKECTFCSLGPLQKIKAIPADVVAHTALMAFEFNNNYELTLSGGTSSSPDRSANYFIDIASMIKKRVDMPISVEIAPPDDNLYLSKLYDAGISAVIMNIEIWDNVLRSIICPGKSMIPINRYLNAIEFSAKLFGTGQVASVLLAGIQQNNDVLDGASALVNYGAIPTIIPFKPFDDCKLARFPRTNPLDVLEIYNTVSEFLNKHNLDPAIQKGCTKCGGCSLENLSKAYTGGDK